MMEQKLEKIAGLNAWTYYPKGYGSGKKFPLILFFPGLGEAGTNATLLLSNGPNRFTRLGWQPDALVISVQPTYGWVSAKTIDTVLIEIVAKYEVDVCSIHLTGLSAGGSGIEQFALTPEYAHKITTVVPMSAPEVTAWYKNIPKVAWLGVSWLGFCGSQDSHYGKMKDLFFRLNDFEGKPVARFISGNYGHSGWNNFYDPAYKLPDTGENIYDWMLSKGKSDTSTPPVIVDPVKYIQVPGDPAKVEKVIVLSKDGTWKEHLITN